MPFECPILTSWRDLDRHGGFCIVRSTSKRNPRVLEAYREDGQRLASCQDRALQAILSKCPKRQRSGLEVEWLRKGEPFRPRLIVRWNLETTRFDDLVTNLPHDRDAIRTICRGYKRRWHMELLLKEWKSSTNLHKFDTEKDTMAEA
jgi:hypothetical protein